MKTLSTGDIAKLCDVNVRTVIRWVDKGEIKAFKLPGRGNNRVREEDFITFLHEHDMPMPKKFSQKTNHILIVDDDRAVAKGLQRTFKHQGYETTVAQDGFQAGVELVRIKPQLMTLDLSMPKVDGFQVLQFIREQEAFDDLRIIVISALNDLFLKDALSRGADAALSKPYDSEQLMDLTAELLSE